MLSKSALLQAKTVQWSAAKINLNIFSLKDVGVQTRRPLSQMLNYLAKIIGSFGSKTMEVLMEHGNKVKRITQEAFQNEIGERNTLSHQKLYT